MNIQGMARKALQKSAREAAAKGAGKAATKAAGKAARKGFGKDALRLAATAFGGAKKRLPVRQGVEAALPPEPFGFKTITGWIKSLLPDTNPAGGLPHQHFWFQADKPSGGLLMRIDNDLKFGTRVANLAPNQALTIRGVAYHDAAQGTLPALDGMHWTHHKDLPFDAGFIRTAAGTIFQ